MSLDVSLKTTLFDGNITHNLAEMAGAAGIYKHLWRPEELGIWQASDLIIPLSEGLERLKAEPDKFKEMNPDNGWGDYEGLVRFVAEYIEACRKFPHASIETSR